LILVFDGVAVKTNKLSTFLLIAFCYFVVCPESLSLALRKIMFRKITYPAKYPEIEKNTQKTLVAIKKRKNSLTVTLDTKKKTLAL